MARFSKGPRLQLYGPNRKYGAKRKQGRTSYVWYIVWQENGQKRERSTGVELGDDPTAAFTEFLNRRSRQSGPISASELLVSDALTLYGEERAPHLADPQRYAASVKALAPNFARIHVDEIREVVCRNHFENRLRQGRKSSTIRRELDDIETALNWCVKQRYVSHSPKIWKPEKAPPRDRWLTRNEAARLLWMARKIHSSRNYLPLFILIALYTGARHTAILQLQWRPNDTGGHVDLQRRLVDFNTATRPKSRKRRSLIPIPRQLYTFLKLARRRNKLFVIETKQGPIKKLRRSFASAVRKADLVNVTPHTLRHTAITWALLKGMRPWDAAAYFGVGLRLLTETYGHHSPDFLKQAIRIVEQRHLD